MVYPSTVTHPGTNRVWCRATTSIEANTLPLSQTANQYGSTGSNATMIFFKRNLENTQLVELKNGLCLPEFTLWWSCWCWDVVFQRYRKVEWRLSAARWPEAAKLTGNKVKQRSLICMQRRTEKLKRKELACYRCYLYRVSQKNTDCYEIIRHNFTNWQRLLIIFGVDCIKKF